MNGRRADFEEFDVSGDLGIRVRGRGFGEILEKAVIAVSSVMAESRRDEAGLREVELEIRARDREDCAVKALNEVIYLFETKRFLVRDAETEETQKDGEFRCRMVLRGVEFNPAAGDRAKTAVKAATYHGIRIEGNPPSSLEIVFDL